ncbi:hypothetical protein F5Y15DRAFT_129634 [Xylariaceae sp. FL0016]|nr:hypothetical protein F5Y15DRAFT_129634 [Xylariaceae sp. FL0016]
MSDDDERHVQFPSLERPATASDHYRPQQEQGNQTQQRDGDFQEEANRRRSSSDPSGRSRQRPKLNVIRPKKSSLSQVPENARLASTAAFHAPGRQNQELDEGLADVLDVIDPEVSTLNNVTNIQNSLFVPSLGRFVNRRPTFSLSRAPTQQSQVQPKRKGSRQSVASQAGFQLGDMTEKQEEYEYNFNHAVLPEGVSLVGWTEEEKAELNDHVRHMLHSRRSKFKRNMKAFGQYVRKPLGFFVTLYAFLITAFGLAWVLFLIGWIYVGEKQSKTINAIDYVLVALFAIVGDGMAPFRLVDTYHMAFIAHYHHLTWKVRQKKQMAKLRDKNDLPTTTDLNNDNEEVSVLTDIQQTTLVHHQNKFAKSHTFYKPHETKTHYAFPLNFLVAIVTLLDLHSCLQISLGATTWGIKPDDRPQALTAVILSCSIAVNITAGILISVGGRRTRKKDVVERMFRQELTREALDEIRQQGEEQGDVKKQLKAEKAIEQGRKSETYDEAMKSDTPIRESVDQSRPMAMETIAEGSKQ